MLSGIAALGKRLMIVVVSCMTLSFVAVAATADLLPYFSRVVEILKVI